MGWRADGGLWLLVRGGGLYLSKGTGLIAGPVCCLAAGWYSLLLWRCQLQRRQTLVVISDHCYQVLVVDSEGLLFSRVGVLLGRPPLLIRVIFHQFKYLGSPRPRFTFLVQTYLPVQLPFCPVQLYLVWFSYITVLVQLYLARFSYISSRFSLVWPSSSWYGPVQLLFCPVQLGLVRFSYFCKVQGHWVMLQVFFCPV
ncbi:unnamed protein product [Ilex paraguariensis]|uniref:Uncharacterized protein n=1 Tax=Ilex paraguariensis TaxID=185542 RepID=A0ABC8RMP5_9AQUA